MRVCPSFQRWPWHPNKEKWKTQINRSKKKNWTQGRIIQPMNMNTRRGAVYYHPDTWLWNHNKVIRLGNSYNRNVSIQFSYLQIPALFEKRPPLTTSRNKPRRNLINTTKCCTDHWMRCIIHIARHTWTEHSNQGSHNVYMCHHN